MNKITINTKYKKGDKVWVILDIFRFDQLKPQPRKIKNIQRIEIYPKSSKVFYSLRRKNYSYISSEKDLIKTQKEAQEKCDKMNIKKKKLAIKYLKEEIKGSSERLKELLAI